MESTTTDISIDKNKIPYIKIEDSVFLGFRVIKEGNMYNSIEYANFYFILKDELGDKYLAKHVFICDQEDLLYLGHNLFYTVNMAKFDSVRISKYREIIKDFNHTNSYYCDFNTVEDIYENSHVCCMSKIEVNEQHECKYIIIPNKIFYKIIYLLEKVKQRYPFNPSIDIDIYFNNIEIYKESKLTYLGILDKRVKSDTMVYPVLKLEYKHIPTGLIIPVKKVTNKNIVLPNIKMTDFVKDYVFDNFLISMDNLVWTYVKNGKYISPRLAIFRKNQEKKNMEVIILDSTSQYIIMHLYEYIFY